MVLAGPPPLLRPRFPAAPRSHIASLRFMPAQAYAGKETTVLELVEALRELGGRDDFEPEFAPARTGEVQAISIDPGRAERVRLGAEVVEITDDRDTALNALIGEVESLTLDDARTTPFLAVGTPDEIAEHLVRCRERWGISYYSVRSIEEFAPVIDRLRLVDARV